MEIGYDAGDRGEPEYPEYPSDHEHAIQIAKEMLNKLRIYDYRQDDSNVVMCLAYIHDGLIATEAILNGHTKLKLWIREHEQHDERCPAMNFVRDPCNCGYDALADTEE